MKKNKLFGCVAVVAMAVLSFILANNNSSQNGVGNLVTSNIEALHASAGGEMTCDQKNKNECTIAIPADDDVIVGRSTGYLIYNW